jgi:hypothetical protein
MQQKTVSLVCVAHLVEPSLVDGYEFSRYKRKSVGPFYALALERIHSDDLATYLERNADKTMFVFMIDEKKDQTHIVISFEERMSAFAKVLGRLYRNYPLVFKEFDWIPLLYDPEVILLDPDQYVADHFSHWEELEKQAQVLQSEKLLQTAEASMQGSNEVLQTETAIKSPNPSETAIHLMQVIQYFAQEQDLSVIEEGSSQSGRGEADSITSLADRSR